MVVFGDVPKARQVPLPDEEEECLEDLVREYFRDVSVGAVASEDFETLLEDLDDPEVRSLGVLVNDEGVEEHEDAVRLLLDVLVVNHNALDHVVPLLGPKGRAGGGDEVGGVSGWG